MSLEETQAKYVELTGNDLPPRFKNDQEWLQGKIDEALSLDVKPEATPVKTKEQVMKGKLLGKCAEIGIPADGTESVNDLKNILKGAGIDVSTIV